jgi:CBS domain-containing protein
MKLREVMGPSVPVASPDESATAAWERMQATRVDNLVVTRDDAILGTLSWHALSGPSGGARRRMGRRVGELMTRDVITAGPGMSVARAAASMRRNRVDCLPIVDRHKLVGLVTTADLLGVLARGR